MGQSTQISRISTSENVMALTFDDGSDSSHTQGILNILNNYGIKSTFFLTGESADSHPDSAQLIIQNGHEIGNHSYSHPYMTQLSSSSIISELQNCESAIYRATGRYPLKLFRPPYGDVNSAVLNAVGSAGYPWTIMWTIDTLDWAGTASDTMVQKVLNNAQPGAIVLMHVGSGTNTLNALPRMIEGLKARGYRFTTISSMLSLPQVPAHPLLKRGSTGSEVRYLQEALKKLGYNPGPIDGIFGPQTEQAVRAFQSNKGLVVDGIVGNNTWAALEKALENPSTPPTPPSSSHPLLRYGSTGSEVRYLQESLSKLGFNPGPIDGIFGPQTDQAVRAFQSNKGLVVDGIVGKNTWTALENALKDASTASFIHTDPATKKITVDPLNEITLKLLIKSIKMLPKGIQKSLIKFVDFIDKTKK